MSSPLLLMFSRRRRRGRSGSKTYAQRWGLVETWPLDSNAGAAGLVGAQAGITLTNVNAATLATAKVGDGAVQLTAASSQSLTAPDSAALSTGDVDFWAACWVYADSLPAGGAFRVIAGKSGALSTAHEWDFNVDGTTSKIRFVVGGPSTFRTAAQSGTITTGQWYFVMGYHDAVNDLVAISVDGGAWTTAATTGSAVPDTASLLRIGARNGSPDRFWDGRVDELSFGKSPPGGILAKRDEIRDRLYNGGSGRAHPFG